MRRNKKLIQNLEKCELAAKLAIKYGSLKDDIPEEEVHKLWKDDYPPSVGTLRSIISTKNIKWYIRNHCEVSDIIWNGSFISGLTKAGKVNWSLSHFPSFRWWGSPILADILESCPYAGKVTNGKYQKSGNAYYVWKNAPALYLKGDNSSISYLAGLLATGRKYEIEGETYAMYRKEVMSELLTYGISIENVSIKRKWPLISPFWPALFTLFMPPVCSDYWLNIKKANKAYEYSAILWLTYNGPNYIPDALPYLQSRRTIYTKYKEDDKSAKKSLYKLRLENNLVSLDSKIRDCVGFWIKISKNNGEEDGIPTD